MSFVPRLSIGLPVYNGEEYLAESLESLLTQSYEDFELIISDNASTDNTADICYRYMEQDSRIRYIRQPRNVGAAPNHNFVIAQARGEYFKWAAADDTYAKELLEYCVDALGKYPDIVLAHAWTALIDSAGKVAQNVEYSLDTASSHAPERFRSLLYGKSGDDIYGVIRTDVIRRVTPLDSYHHSDHTITAELALQGPFYQVPDWLYFRRDHPARAERARPTVRSRCANMDPRRSDRLRHPAVRLYAEYLRGYLRAIQDAPLSSSDRQQCYLYLAGWSSNRGLPGRARRAGEPGPGSVGASLPQVAQPLPAFGRALRLPKAPAGPAGDGGKELTQLGAGTRQSRSCGLKQL